MRLMKAGATSQSVYLEVLDSTSTTGGRKTGLVYNTAGLTAYYVRTAGSATQITLATLAAANSAYSSGGFKEVDATNMPGVYRLDLPDAAVAAGVPSVVVTLRGATGMVQVSLEIQLTAADLQDAVRGGMTALPNANAEAAGGLYTRGTGAGQINQPANGRVDVNAISQGGTTLTARDMGASVLISSGTGTGQLDVTSGVIKANLAQILGTALTETAGQIAAAFKQFFDVASPTGTMKAITNVVTTTNLTNAPPDSSGVTTLLSRIVGTLLSGSHTAQTGDAFARLGAPAGASIAADVAAVKADTGAIKTKTDFLPSATAGAAGGVFIAGSNAATTANITGNLTGNVSGSVGSVTGAVGSVTAGVTVSTNNDKTGYGLSSAAIQAIWDALTSALTTVGSIGKKLADWVIGTAQTGDVYALANGASGFVAIKGDTAAIKAKTDLLPASPAATSDIPTAGAVSDAVWDEAIVGHLGAGSTGEKLNAAGSAGDPWSTALPGAYGAGTAGKIVGDNVNATISSRSSHSAADVWAAATRTLTAISDSSGITTLLSRIASALTITAGKVDVNDKTGFALTAAYDPAKTAAQAGDSMALTSAERNATADAFLDRAAGVETGWTLRQSLRVMLASLAGKLSGAATTTVSIRDVNDVKARITATVDADGNRTAVTTDAT